MRQFRHFTAAVSDLPSQSFEATAWEKRFLCSPVPAIPRMAVKCQRSPPALTKRSPFWIKDQIVSARRFAAAEERRFEAAEAIYRTGDKNVPAWLILDGNIELSRHDGL